MMKALVCSEFGSTEDLALEQRDDLEPGAGEVLINVKAAGVNFPDILTVQGKISIQTTTAIRSWDGSVRCCH